MKKYLWPIIIGVLLVGVAAWLYAKKLYRKVEVTYPSPAYRLVKNGTAPQGTVEYSIISHMGWFLTDGMAWTQKVQAQLGFSTLNQAAAYLGITEGKTDHKTVPPQYAGVTTEEVAAWVKKYVE